MKKIISLIILLIVMLYSFSFASVDVPEDIRVGLYSGTRAVNSFTISSESGMQIGLIDEDGDFELIKEIKPNKQITIKKGNKANSVIINGIGEFGDSQNFVRIIPNYSRDIALLCVNDNNYRGEIEVRRYSTSDMTVINILSMQEYLYGVVPREIGGNSPIEAVKAQAIIARTYAAKNYNKRSSWGFNLTNTVDDQAYGGYDWENPNSNNAVDETCGMVATYNGELIGGYYFSTSGGYTESSVNVWGGNVAYLKAVPDPYEPDNLPKTTWEVTYSADEIKNLLASKNINIGNITNMVVNEVTDAGRVLELEIIGTKGVHTLTKSQARTYLNLNSQWFTINDAEPEIPEYTVDEDDIKIDRDEDIESIPQDESEKKEIKPLLSKLIAIIKGEKSEKDNTYAELSEDDDLTRISISYNAREKIVDTFEIKGRGWGHAVGMSQNGAKGMASNGFTCEEIIKWYYKGVEVE